MRGKTKYLLLGLALIGAFCVPVNALAQETISVNLRGMIPKIFSITSNMNETESVDLVGSDITVLGKVVVFSNVMGTWTISVKSTNGGQMVGATPGNTDVYPYLLNFGTIEGINLSEVYRMSLSVTTPKAGLEYPISVSYEKNDDLSVPVYSDDYWDTITITIAIA